jgi:hypothetical protein
MACSASKIFLVHPQEVSGVKREDGPLLSSGIGELTLIGEALFLDLMRADYVISLQTKRRGHFLVDVLVEV